jgi:hypothetical protein
MRTIVLAVLAASCLALTACGGSSASHDVVPSTLPTLDVPQGSAALAKPAGTSTTAGSSTTGSGTSTDQSSTTGTTGTTTTPPSTTGTTPGTGTTGTTGAGTGGTGSGGTGQTTTNGGTGGAAPGEFSQFCQDNPGACPGN